MQCESLFRSAFSNQSLRLYKKKSISLVVRGAGFPRFREIRENDCITYYPRFVKSTTRRGLKHKQNVEDGWEPDSARFCGTSRIMWKTPDSAIFADFTESRKTDSPTHSTCHFGIRRIISWSRAIAIIWDDWYTVYTLSPRLFRSARTKMIVAERWKISHYFL